MRLKVGFENHETKNLGEGPANNTGKEKGIDNHHNNDPKMIKNSVDQIIYMTVCTLRFFLNNCHF